jgi:hypothetical protein
LDRQKKSQLKYDSAVIEKLVAIAQFGKPRSLLTINFENESQAYSVSAQELRN